MLLQCWSGDTPEDVRPPPTPWSVGRPALNQYIIFHNFEFFLSFFHFFSETMKKMD